MESPRRNLIALAACQALLFATNSTLIAVAGLAGYALASDKSLATLTVTAWVLGTALATLPMSLLMKQIGRRGGFYAGILIAALAAALAAAAIHVGSFWLLCAAMIGFGVYNASAQFYRFTAADAAPAESKATAISMVLAGGLVGGLIGPEASKLTVELFQEKFLGTYLSLLVYFALAALVLTRLRVAPPTDAERQAVGRSLGVIAAQPAFVVAVIGAAFGFGVMNFLMVATPIAMKFHGHHYDDAALVIQSHVIAMFAPSFFTGGLIKRFGVLNIMLSGAVLLGACIGVALDDPTVAHFWLALVLLGVGWNFLYIGGTTLLTDAYQPAERAKTQGVNDLVIYTTQAITSLGSGWMLNHGGWSTVNYLAIPLIIVIGFAVAWLIWRRRTAAAA